MPSPASDNAAQAAARAGKADDAISRAASSQDPSTVRAAYDQAEAIVRDEVPVVPAAYSTSYALSRTGLLGAQTNGLGILRIAGMAWAAGTP